MFQKLLPLSYKNKNLQKTKENSQKVVNICNKNGIITVFSKQKNKNGKNGMEPNTFPYIKKKEN